MAANLAYLDCFSGISGDMLLGALLDAGVPEAHLRRVLDGLHLEGWSLAVEQTTVHGFAATRVRVADHSPGHHHQHRHLGEITALLGRAALPEAVRERALATFTRLAEAEASVHGTRVESIHFHEVGAVDALIDIVGVIAGFAWLGARLVCSPLPMNRGWVRCAHGEIPLPGPAVCRLLTGVPVYGLELEMELVTPTGAALVRELVEDFGPLPPMVLDRTGYGAGSQPRPDGRANLLRLQLGSAVMVTEAQEVEVVETHVDDMNPEFWPYVSERLLAAGALDVALIPLEMKKGRPGMLLRVIAEPLRRPAVTDVLFSETTAIGLRMRREARITLPRETVRVATCWGELPAKRILSPVGAKIVPEYEVCRRVALEHQVPLAEVYAAIGNQADPVQGKGGEEG